MVKRCLQNVIEESLKPREKQEICSLYKNIECEISVNETVGFKIVRGRAASVTKGLIYTLIAAHFIVKAGQMSQVIIISVVNLQKVTFVIFITVVSGSIYNTQCHCLDLPYYCNSLPL